MPHGAVGEMGPPNGKTVPHGHRASRDDSVVTLLTLLTLCEARRFTERYYLEERNLVMFVPQTAHWPRSARRPFSNVSSREFTTSRLVLHFTQYAS